MPRLPVVSGREMLRALKRGGFELERQRGSHAVLVNRERGRAAVVPLHGGKDIPPGTIRGILQQAGLTADDLRALLK